MEDVLGYYALVLTMLMLLAVVVWFCCSIVVSFLKMRQWQKNLRYKALLRENQRLKSWLADTAKEHRLRKVHRIELVRRRSSHPSRNIA
jgi:Na+-transporting methylmalonyl-CoA/oxaloacetate decarboxylase gamma subunit